MTLAEVTARVLRDAPSFVSDVFSVCREQPDPYRLGTLTLRLANDETSLSDDLGDEELVQEIASNVQDYIADERSLAWPELMRGDGTSAGVLDVLVVDGSAQWVGKALSVPVGELRETAARYGFAVSEPWS